MSRHFACDQRAPAGDNWMGYCSTSLDASFRSALSTIDRAGRKRALAVQHDLLADEAFVPLYRTDTLWVAADWLYGIDASACGRPLQETVSRTWEWLQTLPEQKRPVVLDHRREAGLVAAAIRA